MKKTICVALLLAVLLSGCANITKGTSTAQAQVVVFHQQLNDQKLDLIVQSADPDLFKEASRSEVTDLLSAIHRKLGNVTSTQTTNWNIRSFNMATMVILTQNTQFEKGKGTETFTFRVKNQRAYLVGYYINSRELIMK